jgi:hypothetical protein
MHGNVPVEQSSLPGQAHHCRSTIRAELSGSDTCTALGITAQSPSPVLMLCRQLVEAGHDPSAPLDAYRSETLALHVRSIGEAAGLEVNGEGIGFRPRSQPGRQPLVSQNRRVATSTPERTKFDGGAA